MPVVLGFVEDAAERPLGAVLEQDAALLVVEIGDEGGSCSGLGGLRSKPAFERRLSSSGSGPWVFLLNVLRNLYTGIASSVFGSSITYPLWAALNAAEAS